MEMSKMDMSRIDVLSDNDLMGITGGTNDGTASPLYEENAYVYVPVGSGKSFGRVTQRRYDETQGWMYTVQTGFLTGTGFVPQGAAKEYSESSLSALR